jgi:hypothetical protein
MKQSTADTKRALLAGIMAGNSYLASAWLDSKLSSHPFNDIKLVGQMFTTRSPMWQIQGLAGHYGFSLFVALTYAKWFYKRLPGPRLLRGVTFLQLENSSLYALALAVGFDQLHAGIKRGDLPPLANLKTFKGQVVRHIAFGLALGVLYKDSADAK